MLLKQDSCPARGDRGLHSKGRTRVLASVGGPWQKGQHQGGLRRRGQHQEDRNSTSRTEEERTRPRGLRPGGQPPVGPEKGGQEPKDQAERVACCRTGGRRTEADGTASSRTKGRRTTPEGPRLMGQPPTGLRGGGQHQRDRG